MTDLVQKLVGALEGLTAMYAKTWDVVEGGLAMMSDSVEEFEKAHEAARAALSEAKAGGWVAVPVEPTPEMVRAAQNVPEARGIRWHQCHKQKWAAMLAARPLPNPPKEQA